MSYSKTTFVEGSAPGISAAELNKLGGQYDAVKTELGSNTGELWAQIKAVDGAGSGLDADLLQGKTPVEVAKTGVVTGIYTGDGAASRTINLGFTPSAVLVLYQGAAIGYYNSRYYGGLSLNGTPAIGFSNGGGAKIVEVVVNGFTVYGDGTYYMANIGGGSYSYIAFK